MISQLKLERLKEKYPDYLPEATERVAGQFKRSYDAHCDYVNHLKIEFGRSRKTKNIYCIYTDASGRERKLYPSWCTWSVSVPTSATTSSGSGVDIQALMKRIRTSSSPITPSMTTLTVAE